MGFLSRFLNSITMYRLVLYYLILLLLVAFVYTFFGLLPFSPLALAFTTCFLLAVCWVTNKVFSFTFEAPTNVESVYITALILAVVITPVRTYHDLPLLFWAGVLAMASKYMLAIGKKHIFNPAAIAIALTAIGFGGTASWWLGTPVMLPFTLLGLLVAKKIRRLSLTFYFFLTVAISTFVFSVARTGDPTANLVNALASSPLFFFAFVMLTEPLTTPPTKAMQAVYAGIVGVLFTPLFHIGPFYTTPELALVAGNVFSFIVSPKEKLILKLKSKVQVASNVYDFVFPKRPGFAYEPGQYMEWTLPHNMPDARGNRRYFTLASSPTEEGLTLGVKFHPEGSSYKRALLEMHDGNIIVASQLAGEFTLPKDKKEKLVFVAGGIGVTPYRSMIKYLLDKGESRDIVLFYSNKHEHDIAYRDVFDEAQSKLGIRVVYVLTDPESVPVGWSGVAGRITGAVLAERVPDYKERMFYISGPESMVESYKKTLRGVGVSVNKIKTDYFPGYM